MRVKWLAAALAICLCLTGCVMDVESYLQPPYLQQQAVQDALSVALQKNGVADGYTLKYPIGGSITSAFVLLDDTGLQTTAENATMALAFYVPVGEEKAHIHLLGLSGGEWTTLADTVGSDKDIERVILGDADGDGVEELFVGFCGYTNDATLYMYRLRDAYLQNPHSFGRYTAAFVGDMDGVGGDEAVLLHASKDTVSASMLSLQNGTPVTKGKLALAGDVRRFEKLLYGNTSDGTPALYIDAVRASGTYVTEMLYWDGKKLCAPLCNAALGAPLSARTAHVSVMDTDGNGVPEFPLTSRLPKVENATADNTWQWLTEWYVWDVTKGAAVRQFAGIVNRVDGYYIELEDAWLPSLGTRYDAQSATLWLETDGTPFLAVRCIKDTIRQSEETQQFVMLSENSPYAVWFDTAETYRLTLEKISYMLVSLE